MEENESLENLTNPKEVRKEKNKLLKIFKPYIKNEDADGKIKFTERGQVIESLIDEAAFAKTVLKETRRLIQNEGIQAITKNGSQEFIKATPAAQLYPKFLSTYNQLVNALIVYIPEKSEKKKARFELLNNA